MIESEKKVVLVTGACGQLGSELCRTYADLGWTVCITDLDRKECEELTQSLNHDNLGSFKSRCKYIKIGIQINKLCET